MNRLINWLIVTMVVACVIVVVVIVFGAPPVHAKECGLASWYGTESGHVTASGEAFNGTSLTAAHRSLPFGTTIRVTVLATGRSVIVRVNDRGPAKWTHRFLDLSKAAAQRLGILRAGVARVCTAPP